MCAWKLKQQYHFAFFPTLNLFVDRTSTLSENLLLQQIDLKHMENSDGSFRTFKLLYRAYKQHVK